MVPFQMRPQFHKFEIAGARFVLDVGSGAVHQLDDLAWELIDAYFNSMSGNGAAADWYSALRPHWAHHASNRPRTGVNNSARKERTPGLDGAPGRWGPAEVEECMSEFERLRVSGSLLCAPPEPGSLFQTMPLKALCLNVTDDCNLRCAYCFAARTRRPAYMSSLTARKAVDLLFQGEYLPPMVEIDFFGGEPLLNPSVVRETVDYARSRATAARRRVSFTITTNATLMAEEVSDYLNREMDNVILSLDGREEVHDRFRRCAGGKGSYGRAVDGALRFVEKRDGKDYYVRGTYTRFNLDFSDDVLELARLGFDRISMEPVVAAPDREFAIREEDVPFLEREYEKLAEGLLALERRGQRVRFFHFEINGSRPPCAPKLYSGCGAGLQYLAVTPDGGLFPCHQLTHLPGFRMGDVSTGVQNDGLVRVFARSNLVAPGPEYPAELGSQDPGSTSRGLSCPSPSGYEGVGTDMSGGEGDLTPPCITCWARFYCGGGCRANALLLNGDSTKPDPIACRLLKKRVECALYLEACRNGLKLLRDPAFPVRPSTSRMSP